jgi:hypothetical protein
MSSILLVLGILMTGAGIVTIGFGISISEPALGNALIVAGTTSLSAGVILIGLAAAVSQLVQIAQALRPRADARPAARPPEPAEPPAPVLARPAPTRAPIPARPGPEPKVEEPPLLPSVGDSPPEVSASAIERLRSSLLRPGRKPVEVTEAETVALLPEAGVSPAPAAGQGTNGGTPPPGAAVESLNKPGLDFLFRPKPRDVQSESFDSVWPKRPQQTEDPAQSHEPANAAPRPAVSPRPPETPPAPGPEPSRSPAIVKSGVVDGMPYTLYADGSIEAQLPQGTVRFSSIAELRAHIDNNS